MTKAAIVGSLSAGMATCEGFEEALSAIFDELSTFIGVGLSDFFVECWLIDSVAASVSTAVRSAGAFGASFGCDATSFFFKSIFVSGYPS